MTVTRRPARAGPEPELVARLRLTIMRLARRLRQQAASTDVTPSMLSVMSTLEGRGSLTLGEVAEAESVRSPTMTKIVSRLEAAGLVARIPDPQDKRITRVGLSRAGARLIERHRARKDVYLATRLRRLDEEEIDVLRRAAGILERVLEEND
jgi:DNA-binding MarR family transcriptional regulator